MGWQRKQVIAIRTLDLNFKLDLKRPALKRAFFIHISELFTPLSVLIF